jgi:long-chain acyl-CoA synthetase
VGCPGVRDCAVFGTPDEEFGESLVAAIEADGNAQLVPETIMTFLERHIARFKIPKRFVFHDALPREASGKIFKRKLRDAYLQAGAPR